MLFKTKIPVPVQFIHMIRSVDGVTLNITQSFGNRQTCKEEVVNMTLDAMIMILSYS